MHHPRFSAGFMVKAHQLHVPGTAAVIAVPELPDIDFFQAGKVSVQLGIEIFPVAFPESQPHIEAENPLHTSIDAAFHNSFDIFSGIIYKGKNRA